MILRVMHKIHAYDVRVIITLGQALIDTHQADAASKLLRESYDVLPDPRLATAFVVAAEAAGQYGEAAAFLEQLHAQSGGETLLEHAKRLRELESGG